MDTKGSIGRVWIALSSLFALGHRSRSLASNMLTQEQQSSAIAGPCFALRFLVESENRQNARAQMFGFSDAAIFHRWMSLTWTLKEPEAIALLTPNELRLLEEFNAIYESISWVPIDTHPFVSDTSDGELNRLTPIAAKLLKSLESRSHKTQTRRWWWSMGAGLHHRPKPTNNPMDRSGGSAAS